MVLELELERTERWRERPRIGTALGWVERKYAFSFGGDALAIILWEMRLRS